MSPVFLTLKAALTEEAWGSCLLKQYQFLIGTLEAGMYLMLEICLQCSEMPGYSMRTLANGMSLVSKTWSSCLQLTCCLTKIWMLGTSQCSLPCIPCFRMKLHLGRTFVPRGTMSVCSTTAQTCSSTPFAPTKLIQLPMMGHFASTAAGSCYISSFLFTCQFQQQAVALELSFLFTLDYLMPTQLRLRSSHHLLICHGCDEQWPDFVQYCTVANNAPPRLQ